MSKDGTIQLRFESGQPRSNEALKLNLYHVTLKNRDVEVLLSSDASGIYRGFTDLNLVGKWRMTLLPVDEEWKIQQVISLPRKDEIRFAP